MHLTREVVPDDSRSYLAGFPEFVQIDSGLNSHSMQHVDEIFGGQVARRARGVGAATEPADAGVKAADAHLEHTTQRP